MALSWPMMRIIYGASYSEAPSYLQLYLLTYLPIGVGSLCFGPLLNGQGETHLTLRLNALTLIVGAPLSLVLIPRWGINGLIATLVASSIPATAYSILLIKRYFDIAPDWVSSAKIYASSITALAATLLFTTYIYLTPWPKLIAGAAIYVAVYAASIKLTRTLNEEDYRMFKAIIDDTGPLVKPLRRIIEIIEKI
jgi:O-antigen/teichoic acid export membrane protein